MAPLVLGCSSSGGYVSELEDAGLPTVPMPDMRRQPPGPDLRSPLNDQLALSAASNFPLSKLPFRLHIADVNRDGKRDALAGGGSLDLLLGRGDGTFQPVRTIETVGGNGMATADFNGDGNPDLAYGSGMNLRLYLGRGDGTFATGTSLPIDANAVAVAAGDLNRDERVDLVVGDYGTGQSYAYILLGRGDGSFGPKSKVAVDSSPHALLLPDLNSDGKLDIVTANYGGTGASVLLGNGDGSFGALQNVVGVDAPIEVSVSDLNLDGIPDLVLNSATQAKLTVHLGRGDGTFSPAQSIAVPTEQNTYGLAVGDLNRDGVADLAVCSANNGKQLSVLLGIGDGSFRAPVALTAGSDLFSLGIADFNGDGGNDLVATNASPPVGLLVLLNRTAQP